MWSRASPPSSGSISLMRARFTAWLRWTRTKSAGSSWVRKSFRLLPLAFGMAVVVPYQAYAQGVANGLVAPGFGASLLRYLSMAQPWPKQAFDGAEFGITWNHLWYLPYLFTYTALVALTLPLWRSAAGQWMRGAFNGLRGWRLVLLPVVPLLIFTMLLASRFPATHNLVRDFHLHSIYFTMFLYGYWMGVDTGVWKELERLRRVSLALAVAVIGTFILLRAGMKSPLPGLLVDTLRMLYLWLAVAAILGHGHRYLNRPRNLAALGERVGVPVVRASPDADHRRRDPAGTASARPGRRARAAHRADAARLLAPDRRADPPHQPAAAALRAEAQAAGCGFFGGADAASSTGTRMAFPVATSLSESAPSPCA